MMDNVKLKGASYVVVTNVTLAKGSYVKLQPHSTRFTDLSNPKIVLETVQSLSLF